MHTIHNERVKLTASALNTISVATIVTGLIAPAVSFMYGIAAAPPGRFWWLLGVAWLVGGVALHIGARAVLWRVEDMNSLEIYLIIAPLVLGALGLGFGLWYSRNDRPK